MPQRDRQRTHMVVVAVRNRYGVHVMGLGCGVKRQAGAALAFRGRAGVEQQAMPVHLETPGARANVGVRVQIGNPHENIQAEIREMSKLGVAQRLRPVVLGVAPKTVGVGHLFPEASETCSRALTKSGATPDLTRETRVPPPC